MKGFLSAFYPEALRARLARVWWRVIPILGAVVVGGGLAVNFMWQIDQANDRFAEQKRIDALERLNESRAKLESALDRRLASAYSLAAFASADVYAIDKRFASFARQLVEYGGKVRSVHLARNAVITHVYPLSGNENMLGRDLQKDAKRWAFVQRAIDNSEIVVQGPYAFPKGGIGISAEVPVYVTMTHPSAQSVTTRSLWGLAGIELDLLPLLQEAELISGESDLNFAIRDMNPGAESSAAFWGPATVFELKSDPVRSMIWMPGAKWEIAAVPDAGWAHEIPSANPFRLLVILVAFGMGLAAYFISSQSQHMRGSIEARSRSLEDAEERVRTFFQNASEAVLVMDSEGKFQEINPTFADIIGYTTGELRGHGLRDFTAPEQDIRAVNILLKAWRTGRGVGECVLRRKDGTDVQVEFSVARLQSGAGLPVLMAIGHDITERKSREEILFRHSHELEARDAVSSAISGTTDVEEIMRLGLNRARVYLGYDLGQIFLVTRREPARLEWAMAEGSEDALVAGSRELVFLAGEGLPGRVLEQMKPVFVLDVRYDDHFPRKSAAKEVGYQSAIGVPLKSRGEVIGSMEFLSRQRKAMSESDTALLSAIGEQIGVAVENARLYQKIKDSEADFRSLFENSVEGVYRSTMSGQFLTVNPALVRMLGYDSVDSVLSLDMATQVYAEPDQR
ncbi:MAG: PAS domain S-box protein, partial [bacterium]